MADLFKREREAWRESCRAAARKLLRRQASVTIEDVLEICPRPKYLHPNATGPVFMHPDFVAVGWKPSRRPLMNGRQVRRWALDPKLREE